jgi:hypothetical protein
VAPWLALAALSLAVALTLPWPRPLVQRDERALSPETTGDRPRSQQAGD